MVRLPLIDREIPIVADEGVDMEFGTGAVKVTPAHDPLDFEIGRRHDLDAIQVIDTDATITKHGGPFLGQDRFEAREAVRHELEEAGLPRSIEDHHHSVGHCSRCGTVVEPLLSLQWFVKVEPLARSGDRRRSRKGAPGSSRSAGRTTTSIGWRICGTGASPASSGGGIEIPAWYCDDCEAIIVAEDADRVPDVRRLVAAQDEDVLDTWFSSRLWPFSTMGWPEQTDDLAAFYPTSVLVTGFDIIYFWVARMMMIGIHFTGTEPFADVVDPRAWSATSDGRKMSKSSGNALDPLELVEQIRRRCLPAGTAPGGRSRPRHPARRSSGSTPPRRFGNKLWNALRFAVEHMEHPRVPQAGGYPTEPGTRRTPGSCSVLAPSPREYDRLFDEYRFSDAVGLIYNFAWAEVFDWYLEMAKTLAARRAASADATRATLGVVLRDLLKLFHPSIPFLTEELWSDLGDGSLLITASWPEPPPAVGARGDGRPPGSRHAAATFPLRSPDQPEDADQVTVHDPDGLAEPWWSEHLTALTGCAVTFGSPPESAL